MKIYIVEVRFIRQEDASELWGKLNGIYGDSANVRVIDVEQKTPEVKK